MNNSAKQLTLADFIDGVPRDLRAKILAFEYMPGTQIKLEIEHQLGVVRAYESEVKDCERVYAQPSSVDATIAQLELEVSRAQAKIDKLRDRQNNPHARDEFIRLTVDAAKKYRLMRDAGSLVLRTRRLLREANAMARGIRESHLSSIGIRAKRAKKAKKAKNRRRRNGR